MVSQNLARNELENLEGVVDKVALKEIKKNYKKLNMTQRRELGINQSDIVLSFAHNIRIETLKEGSFGGYLFNCRQLFLHSSFHQNSPELPSTLSTFLSSLTAYQILRKCSVRKPLTNSLEKPLTYFVNSIQRRLSAIMSKVTQLLNNSNHLFAFWFQIQTRIHRKWPVHRLGDFQDAPYQGETTGQSNASKIVK